MNELINLSVDDKSRIYGDILTWLALYKSSWERGVSAETIWNKLLKLFLSMVA